jgi:hypothetical protein
LPGTKPFFTSRRLLAFMGNFLAIVTPSSWHAQAEELFQQGLAHAATLKHQTVSDTIALPWSSAAVFARQNGLTTVIATDAPSGSWLLAIGTWFHAGGEASGEESKLLERYLQAGPVTLAGELEGFFTLVVGDGRSGEVVVITDVVGSCHAFMRQLPHALALSASSLLLASFGDCTLDPTACQEFICTGIIYDERTVYREVRKLPAATVFWFSDGTLKKQERYWSASRLQPESLKGSAAVEQLWACLNAAARKITRVFPRPVCDLTGGYDSRATLAAFLATGTVSGVTVSGPTGSPDVIVSERLAWMMGLPHTHFAGDPTRPFAAIKSALWFTDGEYDLVDYTRILAVHQALSRKFDISINGSFGELARGYWWELLVPHTGRPGRLDAAKLARMRYALPSAGPSLFRPEIRLDLVSHFVGIIEQTNAGLFSTPNTFQMDHAYLGMRMQHWQGRIASSTNQLWPCLSPFMFRSVLEVMLQTRNTLRRRSLMVRQMLARFQPQLAAFPLEHGYPAQPATWRNLHRFSPLLHYYGAKVLHRAGVKRTSHLPAGLSERLRLWEEPEVRELLQPASMRIAYLLDRRTLEDFLSESQLPRFSSDQEWRRLLSLEYSLRQFYEITTVPSQL